MELSDQILIDQVIAGDKSKMGILYERYNKDVFSYFYRMTRDQLKSEDLVQNVFLRMIKYSHNFKGNGKFVYWMYSIARNVWIDDYRKSNPLKNSKDLLEINQSKLTASQNIENDYEKMEKIQILGLALERLAPEKKEAIILSRYHDMKYKDIAQLSDCTENTIKSRIKRGIAELQEIVLEYQSIKL